MLIVLNVDPVIMCFPPNLVIGNGVGKCIGCLNRRMVPKACILYFADKELDIIIISQIYTYTYTCIHKQCLGEERIFSFDLSKAMKLCKNPFLGGPYRVAVDLGDILYYHTPLYIGVEIL